MFCCRYLDKMESHPDHWFRRTVQKDWDQARQSVADFVGADLEDVVFVVNATSGIYSSRHLSAHPSGGSKNVLRCQTCF